MTETEPRRPVVYAVVLAAGASARLGRPKQLIPLGGQPLLARTLRSVAGSSVDGIIVVLGHAPDVIREVVDFSRFRARVVVNARFAEGQSTSMQAGLDALPAGVDGVLFVLGDQPLPTAAVYDKIVSAFRVRNAPIVVPVYGGKPGNPVLIPRRLWPKLRQVRGDRGGRDVVAAHRSEIIEVAVTADESAMLMDVDTEADYQRLVQVLDDNGA